MSFMRRVSVVVLAGLLAVSCKPTSSKTPKGGGKVVPGAPVALPATPMDKPEGDLPIVQSPGRDLSPAEVKAVLSRMPAIVPDKSDQKEFALRERSLPPPRPGETIKASFPPPPPAVAIPEANAKPLEVLRWAPEGDVRLAPQITITFSHPMVEVTSHADLEKKGFPVKITPTPPGKWRWIGTQTMLFEPADNQRFPMATVYTVEVPAGTKSAIGGTLAAAKKFTFSTPPVVRASMWPTYGPTKRDPILFAAFDQKIDPDKILAMFSVDGRKGDELRLATDKEIEADPQVASMVASSKGEYPDRVGRRWIAFRAKELLPQNKAISVVLAKGTPSAEGPRKTLENQSFSFRTFGPMEVVRAECGWGSDCRPGMSFDFQFTNPIEAKDFEDAMVSVSPAIANMKLVTSGNYMSVTGETKGRTKYTVKLSGKIPDTFGQKLGADKTYTFNVKSAYPQLSGPDRMFLVLDPTAKPDIPIFSINHKSVRVRLYQVGPADFRKWSSWLQERWRNDAPVEPPFKRVLDKVVTIKGKEDELTETQVSLSPALKSGLGQVVFLVEPTIPPKNRWERIQILGWTEVTQIGLDAMSDHEDLVGWASSLKDGKPLAGVELSLFPSGNSGKTNAQGTVTLALEDYKENEAYLLVAKKGNDVAILPNGMGYWGGGGGSWYRSQQTEYPSFFIFDDRRLYRPGEEVHFKGWVRKYDGRKHGDVGAFAHAPGAKMTWTLTDSRGNQVAKGSAKLNAFGGFDDKVKLPGTMNLGWGNLAMNVEGIGSAGHSFQIEEFRRPEFEVSAKASEGPHYVGGKATVSVTANYFAGGGLPNADVSWEISSGPTSYSPPGWGDYTFGTWIPWWGYDRGGYDEEGGYYGGGGYGGNYTSAQGKTDGSGTHNLEVALQGVSPPRPVQYSASATVMDVNRQAWSASTGFMAHPADLYVGMKSARMFVNKGEPLHVDLVVADLDGKAAPGTAITVEAVRLDWVQTKGQWKEEEKDKQTCNVKSVAKDVRCSFKTPEGGTYKIRANIKDGKQRDNQSELTLWVAGGKSKPSRDVKQEQAQLIPDKKEYQNGDVAEILVQAPFFPAEGIVSTRRSGLLTTERFTMTTASQIVKVKILEEHVPNVYVQVDLVGGAVRTDDKGELQPKLPRRPAFATGVLSLPVPPRQRTLAVKITPQVDKIEPGATTSIDVEIKDAQGKPVPGAEVALAVVDESVLALTGYRWPDPLAHFYGARGADTSDQHLRGLVWLSNPEQLQKQQAQKNRTVATTSPEKPMASGRGSGAQPDPAEPSPAPPADMASADEEMAVGGEAAGASGGRAAQPIKVRANFDALAVFEPALPTDASGKVVVKIKIPDNLTRYRIMAIAVHGEKRFGSGESNITARLPLMVRPSAPRFLNFGDQFQMPVVLQNQTDKPMTVDVAIRATNALIIGGAENIAGRRVEIPANDRVEVRFPAAAVMAGTARFQVGGVSGKWTDAAEINLPVWTPATTEAFATYGVIDGQGMNAIAQPVKAPSDVYKQFGGLEVTTSSTELQALTDAFLYLQSYPFECAEQVSSRVMSVAALRDVLDAFKADGLPPPAEILAAMKRDIEKLKGMQNWDGGWGWWYRGDESWPFLTIHVTHALARAQQKGFDIPKQMLDMAKGYLRNIESHIPHWYGPEIRRVLVAYALYTRLQLGDKDLAKAKKVLSEVSLEDHSMETIGWLWNVLAADSGAAAELTKIRRHSANRMTEESGTAHWATAYSDKGYLLLASDRRADGIMLEAMIKDQPESDAIPKIVRGLLAHKTKGRWGSTQENAWVLLAMDLYFRTFEKDVPDFTARAWLGEYFAGEHEFRGRTTERHHVDVPMAFVAATEASQKLTLAKDGPGRMYYRIGMQYAPKNLKLPPSEHGFTVTREYEHVDKKGDVTRDEQGVWHVKAGARVRVRIQMVVPTRRYHVALVDPMPAGLEAQNPVLATTGNIPLDPKEQSGNRYWWWYWPWFQHQNLRDERAEAFSTLVWEGVHSYSYVARATTPGNFVVPPAKAEEMYMPETFGRSASDRVIVE